MRQGQNVKAGKGPDAAGAIPDGQGPMRRGPSGDVTAALSRETQAGPGGGPA
jgi:hypothetical protein